jgi:hypothetical protein
MTSNTTRSPASRMAELIHLMDQSLTELAELSAGGLWDGLPPDVALDLLAELATYGDLIQAVIDASTEPD